MSLGSDRASFGDEIGKAGKARQGQLKRRRGVWCMGVCMAGVCLCVSLGRSSRL